MTRFAKVVAALALGVAVCGPASADTFTLNNSNGGDGFVNVFPNGFDLFGADDHAEGNGQSNLTTYTAVAGSNQTFNISWTYHTNDTDGPTFDPAGYLLNGALSQLTNSGGLDDQTGSFIISVLAGDTYGIYVSSSDSCCGRADISVTAADATPLPAALPLFAGGLGLIGLLARRRKQRAAH
jgi:hypothetical protein